MARQLNSEEQQLFAEALRKDDSAAGDPVTNEFLVRFHAKRDTALRLSSELAAWFTHDPFGPIIS